MSSSLSVPGYEILDELAQMGNSEIHRALKLDENRLVALKISRSPLDPELLKRFSLESRSLSTFQHPGIVNIYDVGEVEGRPYLALELVEGDRLSERLRQKALSIEDAIDECRTSCRGSTSESESV